MLIYMLIIILIFITTIILLSKLDKQFPLPTASYGEEQLRCCCLRHILSIITTIDNDYNNDNDNNDNKAYHINDSNNKLILNL